MNSASRLFMLLLVLTGVSACDLGPNGLGTAPPGVSQEEFEAQVIARNRARRAYYSGPRGGAR